MTKLKSRLLPNWRSLWKAWSMQLAAIGVVLPELLELVATNADSLSWLDEGVKNTIRLVCLMGVVLLRPIKQESVRNS